MKTISAKEFDKKFDNGEDITEYLDMDNAKIVAPLSKRVNVDFPLWMVNSLDREAKRFGVTRQALIKLWLADRIENRV